MAVTLREAERFLLKHERHYKGSAEPICAVGVGEDGKLHGAAILGRRDEDAELVHIYCDGASQAYSLLYGSVWRTLKALGYKKAIL